ncbi:hypothetical protein H4Q26_016612 [Puccinia striiformis f. sp. tritici PST-130]|nr:hypothetical protein H4Q26_016612 [Puccinia striiformis f. sp. tritici PST-130]
MSFLPVYKYVYKPVVGVVIQSGVHPKTLKVLKTSQVLHRVVPKAMNKQWFIRYMMKRVRLIEAIKSRSFPPVEGSLPTKRTLCPR